MICFVGWFDHWSSLHADHIERIVQSILESGGSLPLVFPTFEIGFSYEHDAQSKKEDASNDTEGYYPRMRVGSRLPHVALEVWKSSLLHTHHGWSVLESTTHQAEATSDSLFITLTDISSQLRKVLSYSTPVFTVHVLGPLSTSSLTTMRESIDKLSRQKNIPLVMVNILHEAPNDVHDVSENVVTLIDLQQLVWKLLDEELSNTAQNACNAIVIVRPDGHIRSAKFVEEGKVSTDGLESAVGDI